MLHPKPKKNLLIADDDPAVLAALADFFVDRGYDVRTAVNGFGALAEIHDSVPDILLSDLNMPRMSGFDLLAVVSRRFPDVRLVAMSGGASGRGVNYGVAARWVYDKGSGLAALLSAIESACL